MEKFENITENNKELAIKIGNNIPDDSIGLGFLSSEPIRPSNSVSMLDLSDTILENRIYSDSKNRSELVYADEFGVLKKFDGRNTFPGDDLTISNLFLNKQTYTENININSTNSQDFVHYFYVSRYFIAAPPSFPLPNLRFWVPQSNFKDLRITVVDSNGSDYIDKETGLKKYRILLEPFLTESNYNKVEVPCRIVVLFDADKPINLKLVYDKIESDKDGSFFNQVLRYSESINSVKYFTEIPEETFVIDPNYLEKQNFSIKKINQKYLNLINGEIPSSGYQIVTPSKAVKDCRTFEAFNWRMIARTRRNVNLELGDYSQDIDDAGNPKQRVVKVAVLYSSSNNDTSNSIINPYIFLRLQNSPFNLSKYLFANTKSTVESQKLAEYWKLDIDSVDDLSEYDILAWSPTSKITDIQANKINLFLRNSGTLILDMSSASVDALTLNPQLKVAESMTVANNVSIGLNKSLTSPLINGGWEIVNNSFEKENYSILGSNYSYRNQTTKSYLTFDKEAGQYADSNSFLNIGESEDFMPSTGLILAYPGAGDSISSGSLVATTFPLMGYCNAIYGLGSYEDIFDLNIGDSVVPDPLGGTYSAVLEGPFKLLYNIISYGLYSKSKASRFSDFRSSLFNFVTPWNSSWVMDGEALFDSEKREFSIVNTSSSTQVYARDLVPTSASIFDFYKSQLDLFLPENQKAILATLTDSDIEYFIELTNFDVDLVSSTKISPTDYASYNIPSSYILFKLDNGLSKLYAFTLKPSKKMEVPELMGPYTVIEQNLSVSESSVLENGLSVLSNFKSYPFDFKVNYTYASATDKYISFVSDVETEFTAIFPATLTTVTERVITIDPPAEPGEWITETFFVSKNAISIKSSIDDLNLLRTTNSSDPTNVYLYTGDIDIHKDPRLWRDGSPVHEYVKYIQYTMSTVGGKVCKVDGIYGSQTAGAVKSFQTDKNQRYKDGTVDSETKSYMAFAWKNLKKTNPTLFNTYKANVPDSVITKYITAAENATIASAIDGTTAYKKLSFSGFTGPSTASDIIWFEIPEGITTIDNITIDPDTSSVWRNFSIVAYGYNPTYTTDIFASTGRFVNTNLSAVSSSPKINMGGTTRTTARYMWIWVVGNSLSGYGSAEGFSIKAIKINGKFTIKTYKPGYDPPPYTETEIVTDIVQTTVAATLVGRFNELPVDVYKEYYKILDTNSINSDFYISEILYTENNEENRKTFSPEELKIGDLYDVDGLNVNFGISPSNLILENATIIETRSQGLVMSENVVGIVNDTSSFTLVTSATYYNDSIILKVSSHLENYRLKDLNGNLFPAGINSVTVNDGVLLACDSSGGPVGILTESALRDSIATPETITELELDMRYGYMVINNILGEEQGFIYGFYDILQKEFLGKAIPVLEIYDRGFQNVYIGVCAIDADGNTQNTNDYIGPTVDMTFKPVNIPFKYIAPVYSVSYSNNSVIKAFVPDGNLTKYDVWDLPITNGSFVKKITIDLDKNWTDWKNEYKGQELSAVYSTLDVDAKIPSEIFGHGYYSIFNEHPEIISSKSIRLNRTPILAWNHKTNYFSSAAGVVKPEFNVFIKQNEEWIELDYSNIKDVNCVTGVIEFKSRLIPNDNSKIKVNYVVESKNNLLSQVDSNPIPLNPLISKNDIVFNKPLYIYITPKIVYKKEIDPIVITIWPPVTPLNKYITIPEFNKSSLVNFTYDGSIFSKDSENYDPFALPIAAFYVYRNPYNSSPKLTDIRVRGGGYSDDISVTSLVDEYPDIISSWDVYPPSGKAYPKGGYVVIRIPSSVKNHFVDQKEIYDIISSNLTAGIVYELQDSSGNVWSRDA